MSHVLPFLTFLVLSSATLLPWVVLPPSVAHHKTAADPCSNGTQSICGTSPSFCSQACSWNATSASCVSADKYPVPSNASLAELVGPQSPLVDLLTISFYGDSITFLDLYQPIIEDAIGVSPYTKNLSIRVFNQGVNGGTVKDLLLGYSPWGHLNPDRPAANTTFLQTLDEDKPNIVVLQIGINDVWQAGPDCGNRCSNVTEFVRVIREEIYAPVKARGARLVLASVSTIGEVRIAAMALALLAPDTPFSFLPLLNSLSHPLFMQEPGGTNEHDAALDAFASAQEALAAELEVPFVPLRTVDEAYETANNCLSLKDGLLTYDGVHPNSRGAKNLANQHAGGLLAALRNGAPPVPSMPPYGGRIFQTTSSYKVQSGVKGADATCTAENGGSPAKAMIVDSAGCGGGAPCRRATVTPYTGDGQIDWVLLPNRTYRTQDNSSIVGFTDARALFAWPLFKGAGSCANPAMGFARADWTTGDSCEDWSTSAAGMYSVGWACGTDNMISGGELSCPAFQHLVCVAP